MRTIAILTIREAARRRVLAVLLLLTIASVVLTGWGVERLATLARTNGVSELQVQDARKQMDGLDSQPMNSARLVGVVREEPKTRQLESGGQLTTLSVATRTMGGKDGSREHEDWHSVALWGKTAQAARDIKVGDTIAINGSLRHRAVPGEGGGERKLSVIDGQKFQVLERALDRQVARRPSKGLDRGM